MKERPRHEHDVPASASPNELGQIVDAVRVTTKNPFDGTLYVSRRRGFPGYGKIRGANPDA